MVIRAWSDAGSPHGARVRITQTLDIAGRDEVTTVTESVDEICLIVRDWIDAFIRANSSHPRP